MGATPKRKRLEKTEAPLPTTNQKFICCRCGTAFSRLKGYFPVSHSPMYRGTGYLPMCGDCVEAMYESYRSMLADDREAMRRVCMKFDLYWNDAIYDMVERTSGVQSRIKNYIGKTNLIKYIDKTFDDTLFEEASREADKRSDEFYFSDEMESEGVGEQEVSLADVDQRIIDFWGAGYAPEFYDDLERRYNDWTGGAVIAEPSDRSLYRQICLLEAMIARDGARGKPIDKNVGALNTLLGSMNLKPAQRRDASDAELDQMPLGVGIQTWEFSRPLPETPDDLKDKSHVIRDITTWFLGHACKMVGLRNSYCKMYEQAMDELRVKHPEYADEDDDTMLADIFGDCKPGGAEE